MLKGIVFDLDGTLWQTGASYLYAYHKLCDHYGITQRLADEVIIDCLGVKIDRVLLKLFPMVENQKELMQLALNFSVEYLLSHSEDCCFSGVGALLKEVSAQYRVFIVSNCLRPYADAFVRISETTDYIEDVYTIEDGEKTETLARISDLLGGKLLFVGDATDDYEAISDHYTQYFCYARYGYKPCDRYDYAIDQPMELTQVLQKTEIKERQMRGSPYRIFSCGENQVTLIHKDQNTAYFGFVNYADQRFEEVVKALQGAFCGKLIGPIDSNTFYSYRFAADSYDWHLYPDCGGEQELPIFMANGFKINQEYVSVLAKLDYPMWERAKRSRLSEEYRVEELSGDAVYDRMEEIYAVAAESFAEAYLYEEINYRDFVDIYLADLKQVVPDLVLIYRKDQPIAFCFCYEDPEKRFYVCKTIAIKKDERNMRVMLKLTDCSYRMMENRGYTEALHHFKNLKNKKGFALFKNTFIKQKKYVLLEYKNDKKSVLYPLCKRQDG